MKWKVDVLVKMGLLTAMSVVLTRFLGFMLAGNTIRISFGDVPIILSGILFGPIAGAITGVAADLVGVLVKSQGTFFPGFTLTAALTGLIPGLIFMGKKFKKFSLSKLIISILTIEVFVHLILNTVWIIILYNKGFWAILPSRMIARVIIAPVEVLIIAALLRALKKAQVKGA